MSTRRCGLLPVVIKVCLSVFIFSTSGFRTGETLILRVWSRHHSLVAAYKFSSFDKVKLQHKERIGAENYHLWSWWWNIDSTTSKRSVFRRASKDFFESSSKYGSQYIYIFNVGDSDRQKLIRKCEVVVVTLQMDQFFSFDEGTTTQKKDRSRKSWLSMALAREYRFDIKNAVFAKQLTWLIELCRFNLQSEVVSGQCCSTRLNNCCGWHFFSWGDDFNCGPSFSLYFSHNFFSFGQKLGRNGKIVKNSF